MHKELLVVIFSILLFMICMQRILLVVTEFLVTGTQCKTELIAQKKNKKKKMQQREVTTGVHSHRAKAKNIKDKLTNIKEKNRFLSV